MLFRSVLRQDPDVILVGEMRDLETVSTALTAAETGHLVFGTIHAASAASTIGRILLGWTADRSQNASRDFILQTWGAAALLVVWAVMPRGTGLALAAPLAFLLGGCAGGQGLTGSITLSLVGLWLAVGQPQAGTGSTLPRQADTQPYEQRDEAGPQRNIVPTPPRRGHRSAPMPHAG